jgi:signal peptidase I
MDSPNPQIVAPGQPEPPPIAVDTGEPVVSPPESGSDAPATASPQQHPNASFAADIVSSMQSLVGTIVIAIFVITFVVQAFQIPSESMENTLLVGDYLLVDKLCYGGHGLGDHIMPYQKISRGASSACPVTACAW